MDIKTHKIVCKGGLPAFVATPAGDEKRPLVVLMHERYGFVKHTQDLAERHARDGFACIAPDFYYRHPDQEALHRGDADYAMSDAEGLESIDAAVAAMKEHRSVDCEQLAVLGICQTGRYPIVYGAQRPLKAAVAWYGAASAREWAVNEKKPVALDDLIGKLTCPTLGIFGEGDHVISVDDVLRFRASLESHKKNYTIEIVGDAPHGWLNDTMPGRYRRAQAEAAWALHTSFLRERFKTHGDDGRLQQSYVASISRSYDFSKNVRYE